MPALELIATGRIDERESAFPQAVQLVNGDILCSFSVGGGQFVHGGTAWARSRDFGRTWQVEGSLLPPTIDPPTSNFLKLSRTHDGKIIYAYGTRFRGEVIDRFGQRAGDTLWCASHDQGKSWGPVRIIPPVADCPVEVSFALVVLPDGTLLAPMALLPSKDRLGEKVLVKISTDGGATWPETSVVFADPQGERGFWEHKFTRLPSGKLLAVTWTTHLGDYHDLPNSFALSTDQGRTWTEPRSTGIRGQTMSALALEEDRLLVLYNRRYGRQGIVMCLVSREDHAWQMEHESLLYDAQATRDRPDNAVTGVDELASFAFGFPTAIRLDNGTILATHWSVEQGKCGIRWSLIDVHW